VTIREALVFGRQQLAVTSDPSLNARLLLEFVLGKPHVYLAAHREVPLTADEEKEYRRLIERAGQQEPIPYLSGQAHFFGRPFHVTPAVLIPRPETEQLVELALRWAAVRPNLRVVDVGTGSGCIAVTLALALPEAHIEATDLSEPALNVARQNAARYVTPGRIRFHQGHLLEPVSGRPDLIIANLPYISDAEWTGLADGVKSYEPVTALRGGPSGLDLIHQLLQQAVEKLSPNGAVFLEIGWKQGQMVHHLAQSMFPAARIELLADYAGNDRIISIV
jgi:release factor glutamine methyltransferase